MSTALNEVIWITLVLKELGISVQKPIRIKEDNQSTIKMGTNNMDSARSKHIDLRHHVIRYYYYKDVILLEYIETPKMISDMLTKLPTKPGFQR